MIVLDYDQLVEISRKYDQRCTPLSVGDPRPEEDREPLHLEVAKACEEAMGPNGTGLVAVRGMRDYASLRIQLLRLAQQLAVMPNTERAKILKEHGLGTDVSLKDPCRPVSSFASQLRFESLSVFDKALSTPIDGCNCLDSKWSSDGHSDLGSLFKQLGMCMVEVGLLVARLLDSTRSHRMCEGGFEQVILESGTAKGRLIHYHSRREQETLSSPSNKLHKGQEQSRIANGGTKTGTSTLGIDSGGAMSTRWQQWHCDYGIFTIITSPLFLKPRRIVSSERQADVKSRGGCYSCRCRWLENVPPGRAARLATNHTLADRSSTCLPPQPCNSPNTPAQYQLPREVASRLPNLSLLSSPPLFPLDASVQECAPPDEHSSLLLMDGAGQTSFLVVPSEYLLVQVGEAAQLLSGGKLVARAHCVLRPSEAEDVSRETMAVFLQPAWDRQMGLPPGPPPKRVLEAGGIIATRSETPIIPLLAARWKDGCTFADFSKETTRQYYGDGARQS